MDWVKRLQTAIDYMEAHLLEESNYEDAAKWVHMSGYEFHRTFSIMAGMTANAYIRFRRLSQAGQALKETDMSVTEAAYRYGYETPESFSKAFTRFHGITPKQSKENGARLKLFSPLAIKLTLEGGRMMDYRIEKKNKQRFIAKVKAFSNESMNDQDDRSIPAFWQQCHDDNSIEPIRDLRPKGKRDLYGLCSPTGKDAKTFDYGIGVILDAETDMSRVDALLQQGFTLWETEPAQYAVFKCMGEDGECISQMWQYFFKEFAPATGYEQTEDTDYEIYFENSSKGMFCELWIPIKG